MLSNKNHVMHNLNLIKEQKLPWSKIGIDVISFDLGNFGGVITIVPLVCRAVKFTAFRNPICAGHSETPLSTSGIEEKDGRSK